LTDISKSPDRIAGMFDAIAPRYDFLNHLLSAGIDTRWRRRAIASLQLRGSERVLDLSPAISRLPRSGRSRAQPASSASTSPRRCCASRARS
jgi:ubiE/COQ5 methyltransferase family